MICLSFFLTYMNGRSYNIGMKIKEAYLDKVEKLLEIASDKTRLKIMFTLLDEDACPHKNEECHCGCCSCLTCMKEKSVNEIVSEVHESQSLVSHQLRKLKEANYVSSRKEGKNVFYCLKDGHIKQLLSVAIEHVMED